MTAIHVGLPSWRGMVAQCANAACQPLYCILNVLDYIITRKQESEIRTRELCWTSRRVHQTEPSVAADRPEATVGRARIPGAVEP